MATATLNMVSVGVANSRALMRIVNAAAITSGFCRPHFFIRMPPSMIGTNMPIFIRVNTGR